MSRQDSFPDLGRSRMRFEPVIDQDLPTLHNAPYSPLTVESVFQVGAAERERLASGSLTEARGQLSEALTALSGIA